LWLKLSNKFLEAVWAKTFAMAISGITAGIWMHRDYVDWHNKGRELYLASKAAYFDKHMLTIQPTAVTACVLLVFSGFFIVYYELIQFLFSLLFKPRVSPDNP
jgi:hypothetical protein